MNALLVAPADVAPVAAAAARALPGGATLDAHRLIGELDERALPEPGSRAVSAQICGGAGTISIVLAPALAEQLAALGADLVAAVLPALGEAAAVLSDLIGEPCTVEAAQEIDASIALPEGPSVSAAQLADGDRVVATLAVALDAGSGTAQLHPLPNVGAAADGRSLDVLAEVEMGLTAELGRTRMLLRDILNLAPGSVIELDRAAGSPVDVLVNGTLVARGEVVVVDQEYGIRITDIVGRDGDRRGRR